MEVNDIIKFEIEFDQPEKTYAPQSLVKGKIIVTPYRNIEVESFQIQPIYQLKSSWQDETKKLENSTVKDFEWKGGEDYIYEFSFKLNQLPSYKSEQLDVRWFIESKVKLKSASRNEIRTLLGKDFQFTKLANPDKMLDHQFEFKVIPPIESRRISTKKTSIHQHIGKKKSNGLLIAAIVILIVGYKSTFMLLLALFLGYQGIQKGKHLKGFISKKVGELSFLPYNKQQFKVQLDLGNSANSIQSIDMNFIVNEEFELFKKKHSKKTTLHQEYKRFSGNDIRSIIEAEFNYPPMDIPTSIKINGYNMVKFHWHIELNFRYKNGTSFTSTETFKVVWDEKSSKAMAAAL